MANKNSKTIPPEEQAKMKQGRQKKKEELVKLSKEVEEAQIAVIKQENINLPEILAERTEMIARELSQNSDIPFQKIHQLVSKQSKYGVSYTYSNEELYIAFNEFRNVVGNISETNVFFIPTTGLFCAYLGISTSTYKSYLNSTDEKRRDIMQQIDDYIADIQLTMSQNRKVDNFTTVFRAEAQHGIVRQQAPVIIEHKNAVDLDDITEKLNRIRRGKAVDAEFKEK